MKITKITQQLKQTNRYSLYVDDVYSFSLSEAALLSSGLASGRLLTAEQLNEYKMLSADDKIYNRALRYVAMRPRTIYEMRQYLVRKDAAPTLIDQILTKLSDIDLLNDAKFAASFVHDRRLLRPTSRRKILLELRKKGIDQSTAAAALGAEPAHETSALDSLITKKRRQSKYQDDIKLMQYLARQGFNYGDIKTALQVDDDM